MISAGRPLDPVGSGFHERRRAVRAVAFRRDGEMFLECQADLLVTGEARPADHIFDGHIGFAPQQGRAGNAAMLNLVEQGGAGGRLPR